MQINLESKISGIVGGKTQAALTKAFGIVTVYDLLTHYPRRYLKRGELSHIDELPVGENVTIVAEVRQVRNRSMQARRGSILEVIISDGHGHLTLTFFNQPWRQDSIKPGDRGLFSGKVGSYKGILQLAHPEYELFESQAQLLDEAEVWATQPVPIYSATSSLTSWQIQKTIALVLDSLPKNLQLIPADMRAETGLLGFLEAMELIHRPRTDKDYFRARHTLSYMEAFVLQLQLLQQKARIQATATTPRIAIANGFLAEFDAALPYQLTDDQEGVGKEIAADLASAVPMNRLVQGEVGSGKTLVALRAMLTVAESGGQSALLVPTEVLATQHFRSIVRMLGPELVRKLQPTLLTGQQSAAEKRKALLAIASGQARLVVGTHALFADKTLFYDLALVVIDEQHRFGVEQRESLRQKGAHPNLLVLTATPIPRTVAMTVFGDLEVSTIKTLPKGRSPIASVLVPLADKPGWEPRIWQRMAEELDKGFQAFVVTPIISKQDGAEDDLQDLGDFDPSNSQNQIATVLETYEKLQAKPELSKWRIGMLHGKLSAAEKDQVMQAFAKCEIQILVATTVIEVGVDVPNASMMVVLSADRFGISQLHQLRGRIGRGEVPGLALFVTESAAGTLARQRLEAVASSTDGFELAQLDLELRREGDVLGDRQSGGRSSLKLLRVVRDAKLLAEARQAAAKIVAVDSELANHPELKQAISLVMAEHDSNYLTKS